MSGPGKNDEKTNVPEKEQVEAPREQEAEENVEEQATTEGEAESAANPNAGAGRTAAGRRARALQIGGSGAETGQEEQQVTEGNAPPLQRRRIELVEMPQGPPTCSFCGKQFASWKAVFGHMRAHPNREWRGAFPPPKGADWSPSKNKEQAEKAGADLLKAAVNVVESMQHKDQATETAAPPADAGDSSRGVSDMEVDDPPRPAAGTSSGAGLKIDLNRSPPNSEDSGDSQKKDGGSGDEKKASSE